MLDLFADVSVNEITLLRFIEARMHCGLMRRQPGADEMIWSRGMFMLLDLDPARDKPSLSLLQSMQHPDDRLTFEHAEANMAAAKPLSRRYRVIRRDGTMRVLSQYLEILFDSNGTPSCSLGLVSDVTELAELEETERLLARRFEAFTRESGLILNVLRADGYVASILGGSKAHEAELNRRYGFLWHDLIHPEDRADTFQEFDRAVKERIGVAREHRIRHQDGSYRWRRSIWTPVLDTENNLTEFVSVSMDIEKEKTIATSKETGRPVSGAQVRAARALVRWSVRKLANTAKVSPSVVRRIEEFDGVTAGVIESLGCIRDALVVAGVEFIFPATGAPGVRLV